MRELLYFGRTRIEGEEGHIECNPIHMGLYKMRFGLGNLRKRTMKRPLGLLIELFFTTNEFWTELYQFAVKNTL